MASEAESAPASQDEQSTMPVTTVAVNEEDKPFRFLDLPNELRNRIYFYALIIPNIIAMFHGMIHWSVRDINAALLRTCRQINREATPILYGENRFEATLSNPMKIFLARIGPSVKFLRNISFDWHETKADTKKVFTALKQMPNLESLDIGKTCWRAIKKPEQMVELLMPLMKVLHKARKGTDRKQAIEVVRIVDGGRRDLTPDEKECEIAYREAFEALLVEEKLK